MRNIIALVKLLCINLRAHSSEILPKARLTLIETHEAKCSEFYLAEAAIENLS